MLPPTLEDDNAEEVQVALVSSQDIDDGGIIDLLSRPPNTADDFPSLADEQWSDSKLQLIILYLRDGELPDDVTLAKKIVAESALYTMADSILYYVGPKSSEILLEVVPAALLFTKWPMVYPKSDQKAKTIARLYWLKKLYHSLGYQKYSFQIEEQIYFRT